MTLDPSNIQIGKYFLGQNISSCSELEEISPEEYIALPKTFVNEKIMRAPDVSFLGYKWNVLLGVIEGEVYKLSVQYFSNIIGSEEKVFSKTYEYCKNTYGFPQEDFPSKASWSSPLGNIILDKASYLGNVAVNLQATGPAAKLEKTIAFKQFIIIAAIIFVFYLIIRSC